MIVITGASSGIGEACAMQLAKPGVRLLLLARREDRLLAVKSRLEQRGAEVVVDKLDLSNPQAIEKWLTQRADLLVQTKVLINNAGLARGREPFQDSPTQDLQEMIATNVTGLVLLSRGLIPHLIRQRGHMVNIGSVAGRWAYPGGHVYGATKSFVRSFNEALRLDLAGTGVRVSEVAPGMVETEFSKVRFRDEKKAKAVYQGMTPLTAQDIAQTVEWILSRPAHVNIQEVVVYPTDQASVSSVHRR